MRAVHEPPVPFDFLRDHVEARVALCVRGAAADWPCTRAWTQAALGEVPGARAAALQVVLGPARELLPDRTHDLRVPTFLPRTPLSEPIDHPELLLGHPTDVPLAESGEHKVLVAVAGGLSLGDGTTLEPGDVAYLPPGDALRVTAEGWCAALVYAWPPRPTGGLAARIGRLASSMFGRGT